MFVISLKSKHLKRLFALTVAIIVTVIGGVVYVWGDTGMPVSKVNSYSMKAETPEERQMFFNQVGYEVSPAPVEIKEIIIPEEFDEVYSNYNELQNAQGLDLTPYKGKRVKSWSYEITNYPNYESSGVIRGNLLTYNGVVIACDISSVEMNGFMEKVL